MSAVPLVTIGITCHNAETTIEAAVRSAQAQTWSNLEILVVDDASVDESVEIVSRMAAADSRIRLIRLARNRGVAAARNLLVREARGEFLAFFDDDDTSAPERVGTQVARLQAYETATGAELAICHTARTLICEGEEAGYVGVLGADQTPAPSGLAVFDYIMTGRGARRINGAAATCSQMARLRVYRRMDGFDETMDRSEDTEFNLRAALAGAHFPGVSRPLVRQTMTQGPEKHAEREREAFMALIHRHGHHARVASWYRFNVLWCQAKYDYAAGQRMSALLRVGRVALYDPVKLAKRLLSSLHTRRSRTILQRAQRSATPQSEATHRAGSAARPH
jgi:glycosyltransferase involved in cell wall biosynthesis